MLWPRTPKETMGDHVRPRETMAQLRIWNLDLYAPALDAKGNHGRPRETMAKLQIWDLEAYDPD